MLTSTKKFLQVLFFIPFVTVLGTLTSYGQTITGTVFRDFNSDGVYMSIPASGTYAYGEPGVGGITVTAYNAAGTAVATTTSSTVATSLGTYTLTVGNTNAYRVEFSTPTALNYFNDGFHTASGSGTSVQFVNGGATSINFGVSTPTDYCQDTPPLAVPCYVSGDPQSTTANNALKSADVLVNVPYNSSGASAAITHLATAVELGSVFGAAYQRETKKLFTAAFLKRHVGLGSGGLGGIYVTSNITSSTATNALYVDLENAPFSLDLGQSTIAGRVLPGNAITSSTDPLAFDAVGKIGLGGLAMSSDGKTLYAIDLKNRQLLALAIGNPAKSSFVASDLTKIAIPDPGCTNGVGRPFAVAINNGKVYIGVVCTGETSASGVTAGTDLSAYVYAMPEGATSIPTTEIFTFRLNYNKGRIHKGDAALGSAWEPWASTFNQIHQGSSSTVGVRAARAQPMLSDISFTDNGDMLLAFMDRGGHQLGYKQRSTTDVSASPNLLNGYIGGDLLRAHYNGTAWVLENNATVGSLTSAGAGNGQGPSTPTSTGYTSSTTTSGEFYYTENFIGILTTGQPPEEIHQETITGSALSIPGLNQTVTTVMDPLSVFSGGFSWFNNITGSDDRRAQIFNSTSDGITFGKANGLGVIKALCNPAPIQIGNRVWIDNNNNGIQDPGEAPLAGVKVTLTGPGVTAGISVTTNSAGEYYFSNTTGTAATGFAYSLTGLTSGSSYSLSFPTTFSTVVLSTKPNTATGANASNIDTDPNAAGLIIFTLGQSGQNNYSYDAGYVIPPASLGDYVFLDANKDGIQNTGDTPIQGVTVILYTNGVASATTVTNASGLYSFTGLTPGSSLSYSVGFTTPTGYTATTPLSGTDRTKDSDADLITGRTASVTLAPGEYNPNLDAGYYLIPAGLGDYVFLDANKDGIQNTGDTPLQGVTVVLYTNGVASATTVTNASGLYSFTGLTPGSSLSYSVGFTTPTGYTATTPLSGTDRTKDSDADLITGRTASVTLAPGEFNPTLDAGYYIPSAGLGDYVFLDANKDGIQNTGDTPIAGVTVVLYTNGVASATTVTNASGLYSFTGLTPGSSLSYSVGFTAPAGYTATLANQGTDDTKDSDADPITGRTQSVTLAPGEFNPTLDAGYYIPTAGLGDYVFLDANKDGIQNTGDTPLQGVTVTLYTNGVGSTTAVTNASGFYSFTGLTPGSSLSYSVGFTTPAGYTATLANQGSDDTKDSDADPITGKTQSVTLAPAEFNPTLDAGYYIPSAGLGDYVFLDVNKDGIQNTGDTPLQGVTVILYTNGVASATTVTNASGFYSFTGLTPGSSLSYSVGFTAPAGYTATLANQGTDDTKDSDADLITSRTASVTLAPGEFNPTLDAGYYIPSAGLGDYVFLDANKDGIQNTGDTPIQGVTVVLYTNGVASATTVTNASGFYSFTGLTSGSSLSYSVGFTAPASYTATLANQGTDDTKDSDADPITGRTQSVTLAPNEYNPTLDAGFILPPTTLELDKFVDKSKAKLGDILTYSVVITNTGSTTATNVVVTDSSTTGLTYNPTSVSAPTGTTFSLGTPNSTWTIPSLSPGQSLSLIIQARVDSAGILYNKAYIPGDTATVCSSIPYVMCAGDSYAFTLTAPAGRSSYKWYKDNVEIVGQTTNVLEVTAPGTYSLAVDNVTGKCPDFSCCPFIVEEDSLPTFQALATPVTCVANTPQANGQITLSGFKAAYTYQYSLGRTFNQAASLSGAAKAIPAGGVIVSNLVNPAVAQAYTVRVYNASGCYTDVTVMLMPTVCGCPADVCVPYVITQSKRAKRIGDPR
ncbi:SdrD B-like domain-containing protein [Spirosoma foliorum]|uniref:DUF11 domain-containing protein n=1 Tax=Spirosoma foliorum TaxID=2710596 RepID=A0A7G5GQH3_9BACT|nr:SdrD B-like domain-containing protein [Spirosoma foliorum]QMW01115.1 DUF11 domain-containing protein [Spirosoma foliorum]